MNGKGDRYRPVNREQYEKNYDKIFKKSLDKVNDERKAVLKKLADGDKNDKK